MPTNFDPNGPGIRNGNFIGLPFTEEAAELVFFPVPWDVTVSYGAGTSNGPQNILEASPQLDLMDLNYPQAWEKGLFFRPVNPYWKKRNAELRPKAEAYINLLERGEAAEKNRQMQRDLEEINQTCKNLHAWVETETSELLKQGKKVGLIGGEHSSPLGLLRALARSRGEFGILQIDAHLDLRAAYEGFIYSHASIFYNVLKEIPEVSRLTSVGIRDFCAEEYTYTRENEDRVQVFYQSELSQKAFNGTPWAEQCRQIVSSLPDQVYISFDIDGLDPGLCPHTGTPVPGGLRYGQAVFLLETLQRSGREIIGFDLSEVAGQPYEWDGNVGARLAYKMACLCLAEK